MISAGKARAEKSTATASLRWLALPRPRASPFENHVFFRRSFLADCCVFCHFSADLTPLPTLRREGSGEGRSQQRRPEKSSGRVVLLTHHEVTTRTKPSTHTKPDVGTRCWAPLARRDRTATIFCFPSCRHSRRCWELPMSPVHTLCSWEGLVGTAGFDLPTALRASAHRNADGAPTPSAVQISAWHIDVLGSPG